MKVIEITENTRQLIYVNKFCHKCDKEFKIGDILVRTRPKKSGKIYHEICYMKLWQ